MTRTWQRVLLIAPHPDDESLATGGLLRRLHQRGAAITIVFVTDGEYNHWPQRYLERRWRITGHDRLRWGARRRQEARRAVAALEVQADIRFTALPDNLLMPIVRSGSALLTSTITALLNEINPDLVIAPSLSDLHPDHQAVALVLDQLRTGQRRYAELRYLTHGSCSDAPAFEISLTADELVAKRRAIACHATQLALSRKRFHQFARDREHFYEPESGSRPRFGPLRRLLEICFPQLPDPPQAEDTEPRPRPEHA